MRRVVAEALMEHLAAEHLDRAEFDHRLRALEDAGSAAEIRALLDGLPGRGPEEAPRRPR